MIGNKKIVMLFTSGRGGILSAVEAINEMAFLIVARQTCLSEG